MIRNFIWSVAAVSCFLCISCGKKSDDNTSPATETTSNPPAAAPASNPSNPVAPSISDTLESVSPGTPLKSAQAIDSALATASKNVSGYGTLTIQSEVVYDYAVTDPFKTSVAFSSLGNTSVTGAYSQPTIQALGVYDARSDWFGIQTSPTRTDRQRFYAFRDQVNILGKTLYSTDSVLLLQEEGSGNTELVKVFGYNSKTPTIQRFKISLINQTWNAMRISVIKQTFQSIFSGTPNH